MNTQHIKDKNKEEIDRKMEQITGEPPKSERSFAMEMLLEFKTVNQRQFFIILILVAVLVASNFYWLYTFTQYDFVTYEQSTEGGGNANFIGNDGDIINGKTEDKKSN